MATKKGKPAKKASPAKKATAPVAANSSQRASASAAKAAASANKAARAAEEVAASIQRVLAELEQRLRTLSGARRPRPGRRALDLSSLGMQPLTGCSVVGDDVHFTLADGSTASLDDVLSQSLALSVGFGSLDPQERSALKAQLVPLFRFLAQNQAILQSMGILVVCLLDES
jgi:hypothetical protein